MIKKILKSWITWAIVAVACFATAYFINANQAPVEPVEVVEPTAVVEQEEVVVPVDTLSVENIEKITTTSVTKNE